MKYWIFYILSGDGDFSSSAIMLFCCYQFSCAINNNIFSFGGARYFELTHTAHSTHTHAHTESDHFTCAVWTLYVLHATTILNRVIVLHIIDLLLFTLIVEREICVHVRILYYYYYYYYRHPWQCKKLSISISICQKYYYILRYITNTR